MNDEQQNLLSTIGKKVELTLELVLGMKERVDLMALDFTKLQESVAAITSADAAILALVNTLAAEIKTMAGQLQNPADQATLNTFADQLTAQAAPLTAAVLANTPPSPAPAPAPAAKKKP